MKSKSAFLVLTVFLIIFFQCTRAISQVVYCTNCSDSFTQQLQQVTNIQQLGQLYEQVAQALQQTQQQIQMVQTGFQQLENMVQNTKALPQSLIGQAEGIFGKISSLSQQLKTNNGDISALSQLFKQIYPAQDQIASVVNQWKTTGDSSAMKAQSATVDQATTDAAAAAFEASGSSISDIQQNASALDQQIGKLLQTPEGQMQAIQAGNQLVAMQLGEAQKLRQLMSVYVQAQAQKAMEEKYSAKLGQEASTAMFKMDALDAVVNSTQHDPSSW